MSPFLNMYKTWCSWRRARQPNPVFLLEEFPWTEDPGGPVHEVAESNTTEWPSTENLVLNIETIILGSSAFGQENQCTEVGRIENLKKTKKPGFLMTNGVYASNLDSSISRFLATRIVIHLYCLSHCKALCHFAFKCILTYTHILCPCIDICYVYTFFAFLYFTWLVAMWSNKTRQSRKERKYIWAAVYQHCSGKKYSRLLYYHLPVSYLKSCWDTLTYRLWLSSRHSKVYPSFPH